MVTPALNGSSPVIETIPFMEWPDFVAGLQWNQGEHFALIGPTGCGKTTAALNLLPLREYTTVFATKPKDNSLVKFGKDHDYKVIEQWKPSLSVRRYPRRILWPNARSLASATTQRQDFYTALDDIYVKGGWCIYFDELWYISNQLNLRKEIITFLLQARSMNIGMLMAFQRPAWVPVEVYDQATHLMFWRENDEVNLSRIQGIAYNSNEMIRQVVSCLPLHQALYINTRNGSMVRTIAPAPDKGKGKG